ncbi:hypothetical protein, partial [Nitrospirillum amazonense]|uniref:hypothetical protein n=1 Tax=Nitrospirillum amazonense TaxID=28077 RepID=UPI00119DB3FB
NGRGPWWNAGASHMNDAYRKSFFDTLGLPSLNRRAATSVALASSRFSPLTLPKTLRRTQSRPNSGTSRNLMPLV